MRLKQMEFGVTVLLLCVMFVLYPVTAQMVSQRPWLEPQNPTRLEWLVLELQAHERDDDFGENGVTMNYYLGPLSRETGQIYCDIDYLPNTKAEFVQQLEDAVRRRFELRRKLLPWASRDPEESRQVNNERALRILSPARLPVPHLPCAVVIATLQVDSGRVSS